MHRQLSSSFSSNVLALKVMTDVNEARKLTRNCVYVVAPNDVIKVRQIVSLSANAFHRLVSITVWSAVLSTCSCWTIGLIY